MTSPPRRGRRRRLLLAAIASIALLLATFGCTATITPPRHVTDPTTVFVLREAMHTGLVLPPAAGSKEYVEFGFGDWSWFALGNDAWYHAFATVLWPTAGTLGRRTFFAADDEQLRRQVHWATLSGARVDGGRVRGLRAQLEARFARALPQAVQRPELGWTFVPCDRSYWFPQNCADVAAEWLADLDCEVSWVPICTALAVGARNDD